MSGGEADIEAADPPADLKPEGAAIAEGSKEAESEAESEPRDEEEESSFEKHGL